MSLCEASSQIGGVAHSKGMATFKTLQARPTHADDPRDWVRGQTCEPAGGSSATTCDLSWRPECATVKGPISGQQAYEAWGGKRGQHGWEGMGWMDGWMIGGVAKTVWVVALPSS